MNERTLRLDDLNQGVLLGLDGELGGKVTDDLLTATDLEKDQDEEDLKKRTMRMVRTRVRVRGRRRRRTFWATKPRWVVSKSFMRVLSPSSSSSLLVTAVI